MEMIACKHCGGLRIGDVVECVRGDHLFCGSGTYPHAVVVSVKPFVLVSEEGDMMWRTTQTPRTVRRVAKRIKRAASFARWEREADSTLIGDCQECM